MLSVSGECQATAFRNWPVFARNFPGQYRRTGISGIFAASSVHVATDRAQHDYRNVEPETERAHRNHAAGARPCTHHDLNHAYAPGS